MDSKGDFSCASSMLRDCWLGDQLGEFGGRAVAVSICVVVCAGWQGEELMAVVGNCHIGLRPSLAAVTYQTSC